MFSFQSVAKIAIENLEKVMKEKCASCEHNKTIKGVCFCANSKAENCFETTFDAMYKHGQCMFYEHNRKERNDMDKVYIITAGSYSGKHIVAVFITRKEAEQFCCMQNLRAKWDSQICIVNEYPIGADISLAGKQLYCAYEGLYDGIYAYETCESIFEHANEIGVVKDNGVHLECYVSVDMNCDEPEEYAQKVAADLFAEYKARKEGIT